MCNFVVVFFLPAVFFLNFSCPCWCVRFMGHFGRLWNALIFWVSWIWIKFWIWWYLLKVEKSQVVLVWIDSMSFFIFTNYIMSLTLDFVFFATNPHLSQITNFMNGFLKTIVTLRIQFYIFYAQNLRALSLVPCQW